MGTRVGIAVFAGGASVSVAMGGRYLAQAHSKKRLTPTTTAYQTVLDNLAALNRRSTLHMTPAWARVARNPLWGPGQSSSIRRVSSSTSDTVPVKTPLIQRLRQLFFAPLAEGVNRGRDCVKTQAHDTISGNFGQGRIDADATNAHRSSKYDGYSQGRT